jgi:uncharacterized DUF497 family protein
MAFEWEEAKRLKNLAKHGVDVAEGFDWDDAYIGIDDSMDYGEVRLFALGWFRNRIHHVTFTERGSKTRIISFRKATTGEVKVYEEEKN